MIIHKDLKKYYKHASKVEKSCKCKKSCGECVVYVSCGPWNMCKIPCEKCLCWAGYGKESGTVEEVIKRCKKLEKNLNV